MQRLIDIISERGCVLAPGVYDCLTARLVEDAGFAALSISGYSVEASKFGLPDLGFAGMSDTFDVAERICASIRIPVICDADTGYGGVNNVWETVRRLERAGVAGLHIEDQVSPKRCGGLSGRSVVPVAEMEAKIRAARDARRSDGLAIIARTDAKATGGLDEVIRRLNAYLAAGADIAFAAENYTSDEVRRLGADIQGTLAICGGVPGWSGSFETAATYAAWRIGLVLYPFATLYPAARAIHSFLREMASQAGVSEDMAAQRMCGFDEFGQFIGVDRWAEREAALLAANGPGKSP